jgi:hypothetical protein
VAQMLQDASFPPEEFEELKREYLTEPPVPARQSRRTVERRPERISTPIRLAIPVTTQRCQNVSNICARSPLTRSISYRRDLIGTARGEIAIVGDFDEKLIEDELAPAVSREYLKVGLSAP